MDLKLPYRLKVLKTYIYFLLLIFLFASCSQSHYSWQQTEEGTYLFVEEDEQGVSYSWQGETFDKVAHGNGMLTKSKGSTIISSENKNAFYGSLDDNGVTNLNNGGKYIGNLVEDKMTGFGVLIQGSDLYIGDFKDGKPDGILNQYKNNRIYYSGTWQNGLFNGDGILYKEDGKISEGIWRDNKLAYTFVDIDLPQGHYTGYIKDGKPTNEGTMLYSDSCLYDGEWDNGMWNGYGTLRTKEILYDGDFVNNKPDGIGYILYNDSSSYNGEWLAGNRSGSGDMILSTGDLYSGEWDNNLFNGYGIYSFANGDIYEGEWKEGLQDGNGKYTSIDFDYEGQWEEGWINGEGAIKYKNGDIYVGNFVENERYGTGKYQFANGNIYEGEFVDNKIQGLGTFQFSDGCIYEGEFWDGKIKGDGTLSLVLDKDTVVVTANWDGTDKFPKEASILLSNGLLYEGEIIDGKPTRNGIWTSTEENWIKSALDDANDYYKQHKEIWDKVVLVTSIVLSVVEVGCDIAATVCVCMGVSAPVAPVLLGIGKAAGIANVALNVADATASIASASLDGNWEVAINAALIAGPKFLKLLKKPARKIAVPLSKFAKNIGRKTLIILNKSKTFKKFVKIIKNKAGELEKKLISARQKNIAKRIQKINKKIGKRGLKNAEKKLLKSLEKDAAKFAKAKTAAEKAKILFRMQTNMKKLPKDLRALQMGKIPYGLRNKLIKFKPRLPKRNGHWTGEPGNSTWVPDPQHKPKNKGYNNMKDKNMEQIMKEQKVKGIPYKDGIPDFSSVSKGKVSFDWEKELGKDGVKKLTGPKKDRKELHEKAFEKLAKEWGMTVDEVKNFKEVNNLVWHEDIDCKTLQLIPREIHDNINHTGGVSLFKIILSE